MSAEEEPLLPKPPTTVEGIKRLARQMKKRNHTYIGQAHHAHLDAAARYGGWRNFAHALSVLQPKAR